MSRRALRPSFVVTFALGAAAIAGCSSSSKGNGSIGDSSIGDGAIGDGCGNDPGDGLPGEPWCPAEQPCTGAPCDAQSWAMCGYGPACSASNLVEQVAVCLGGTWSVNPVYCGNPPAPVSDAGPDVHDGGPDGEGQDGGHD
jgi:hypothetical protein